MPILVIPTSWSSHLTWICFLLDRNTLNPNISYWVWITLFSLRVESFIEHQDICNAGRIRSELQTLQPPRLSRTASSPSPSSDTNFTKVPWAGLRMPNPTEPIFLRPEQNNPFTTTDHSSNLELQLLPSMNPFSNNFDASVSPNSDKNQATQLQLSIGSCDHGDKIESNHHPSWSKDVAMEEPALVASRLKEGAREQLRLAMVEKAIAEETRQQAKRQIELAEQEFANSQRIRQQAQAELLKAQILRQHATKQINSTIFQITCQACKQQFEATTLTTLPDENSLVSLVTCHRL